MKRQLNGLGYLPTRRLLKKPSVDQIMKHKIGKEKMLKVVKVILRNVEKS